MTYIQYYVYEVLDNIGIPGCFDWVAEYARHARLF